MLMLPSRSFPAPAFLTPAGRRCRAVLRRPRSRSYPAVYTSSCGSPDLTPARTFPAAFLSARQSKCATLTGRRRLQPKRAISNIFRRAENIAQ